jgi:hypothetical protein
VRESSILIAVFCFLASLLIELLLEYLGKYDSVGFWYSIYFASICTLVIVPAIKLIAMVIQRFRKRYRR